MQYRGCRLLQLVDVVPAEGDLDGGPVGVPVVLDLEMERLEQATQDRLGQLAEASAGRGKRVQEVERVGIGLPLLQSGQLVASLLELAFEVVELLADLGEQLAFVIAAAERGIQRIRHTHHLPFSFLRYCGLSLW